MQRNVIIIVLMMALSFLAALLLTGRLQRGISERLLELADTARQVSGGKNFSSRAVTHGNDETGALIEAFNDMLVQIQSRDLEAGRPSREPGTGGRGAHSRTHARQRRSGRR